MAEDKSPAQSPAQRIFALCDKEGKGFVTKKDMLERMQNQLPLKPEQLEVVFDSLDSDGNGTLTFEEFVQGFGVYLEEKKDEATAKVEKSDGDGDKQNDAANDDVMRHMECLGTGELLQDENIVKQLTEILDNQDNKRLLEKIFNRISQFVQSKEQERITMEDYMRQQIETREEEHRKMYEEMELQITKELKRIDLEGRMREAAIERDLTDEILKKKQQIEHLSAREQELEETLSAVREGANAAKLQVAKLLKEKKFLEGQLEMQTRLADDFRGVCERLRRESVAERRQRAMAALAVAQDIAVERAGLVSQLQMLRAINTRLMDESDMRKWGSQSDQDPCEKSSASVTCDDPILKQAEVDDEYQEDEAKENGHLNENGEKETETSAESNKEHKSKSLFDELSGTMALWQKPAGVDVTSQTEPCRIGPGEVRGAETQTDESTQLSEKTISVLDVRDRVSVEASETDGVARAAGTTADPRFGTPCTVETSFAFIQPIPARVTNVNSFIGYHAGRWTHEVNIKRREVVTPCNVYKIIVLGDVGVGKTSFVRRFCCGEYTGLANGKNASGIDCSVRCLPVGDDQHIALQFWDAAGKNKHTRQRNIGRQLVRKADALVVMYDVTSEDSFRNARRWMASTSEEAADSAVRVLIGNKVDLLEPRDVDEHEETVGRTDEGCSMTATVTRFADRVSTTAAMQLAESFGCHFFETSAKSGYMVHQTLVAVAAKLQVKERIVMEGIALDADDEEESARSEEDNKCV